MAVQIGFRRGEERKGCGVRFELPAAPGVGISVISLEASDI
jgi:hypothetical protein